MAKMIPSALSPNIKSPAERKIFEWFKNDPVTKDWVVFHSLGIENHQTVVFGEIDFLVAASNQGVFALEVKGGRIRREDGVWVYTDKYGVDHEKVRGPFEQASEGMYSVKNELFKRSNRSSVKNALCGYGVMFPDIEYDNTDIDVSQSQIFDKRDGQFVGRYIKRLADYNKEKFKDKKVFVVYPSEDDVSDIVNVLRRDFDKALPLSTKLEYAENTLLTLTEEQYRCIDGLASNKRCLVNGAAGTGKTVLAIKNVKESVTNGEDVGFFCYNLKLANELKKHFADFDICPAYVGSLTDYLTKLIEKYQLVNMSKVTDIKHFYDSEFAALALEAIELEGVKFDKIVLDEAQDLIKEDYLLLIDALLVGGLKKGKWFFFGDFDYQTINNRGSSYEFVESILEDEASFAVFNLTVNCRNTTNIQREMNKVVGINIESLNKDKNMPDVKYIQFEHGDIETEKDLLEQEIKTILAGGVKKKDITILSPFKFSNSVASKLTKYKICGVGESDEEITYCTIQGFKGLENAVIILTDIQTYNKPDLMYVAMSRARSALYVLETTHAKKYRETISKS